MNRLPERLPSFIIAGAAKSATTWLQRSLQNSSEIFMPDHEPHFFSRFYDKGIEHYHADFARAQNGAILGEKSNSYLTEPEAAVRIRDHIPSVKLIFQLRDPVVRAYSDYAMLYRRGEVDEHIHKYLDPDRAAEGRFLHDGRYADHLERFYALFDPAQIAILRYEDVANDPAGQLDRLAAHLDLSFQLAPPVSNRVKDAKTAIVPRPMRKFLAPFRPALDPFRDTRAMIFLRSLVARPERYPEFDASLRNELASFYRPQIDRLEKLTGGDFSIWRSSQAAHHPQ